MRTCTYCKIAQPLDFFSIDKGKPRSQCKECRRKKMAQYRQDDPEKARKSSLRSYHKNVDKAKERQAKYRSLASSKEAKNQRESKYRKDPVHKLKRNYSNKLRKFLKQKKSESCRQYLGCSFEDFKIHLESLFLDGMTWENYGSKGWHVDHKIPLSSASTLEDIIRLSHYTNLQPLWWYDNLSKGSKIVSD
jgi:hypothetical protein